MYLKYINNINKKYRIALSIVFWILAALSLCLFLSIIIDDGYNQFAKLFYVTELKKQPNPNYATVLNWAKESNVSATRLELLTAILPKEIVVDVSKQDPTKTASTSIALFLTFYIFMIHATMINTISYSFISTAHIQGKNDGIIPQAQYDIMDKALQEAKRITLKETWEAIKINQANSNIQLEPEKESGGDE